MELALSLGDTPKVPFPFLDKPAEIIGTDHLGFCMAVGKVCANGGRSKEPGSLCENRTRISSSDPPVQLDLLPFSPVHRIQQPSANKYPFPWLTQHLVSDHGRRAEKSEELGPSLSSPNSAISSFQMEFSAPVLNARINKRNYEELRANSNGEGEAASSRGSDDEENGLLSRKKLRLTKEQSAFLEDTFKQHNSLNPKDKLALAKQLNLSTRQVEVWFQNRRARTKLKQTEVDCEYLKRCCETLKEENRRMQKELQELRALKASKPFYMQLPATTLTMCPSCERVTVAAPGAAATTAAGSNKPHNLFSLSTGDAHAKQAAS